MLKIYLQISIHLSIEISHFIGKQLIIVNDEKLPNGIVIHLPDKQFHWIGDIMKTK